MPANVPGTVQAQLNRMNPTAFDAKLGDLLNDLITKHNALLAKLDADAGVTDTNYTALHSVAGIETRAS